MSLWPLYLINFINALGFSIVIPYLVYWAVDFGGSPALYGAIGAIYSGTQLIGAPILGAASDRYGRKKLLFLSQLGTLISWIGILCALKSPRVLFGQMSSSWLGDVAFTLPLILLVLSRAFDGLTAGNISIANAYLSDLSDNKSRSKNFGRMSSASSLGFILGPALAGLIGNDLHSVYAALFISFVALFCIQFFLRETPSQNLSSSPCKSEARRQLGPRFAIATTKFEEALWISSKNAPCSSSFFSTL